MVHLVSICQVAPELGSPGDLLTFGLLLGRPGPTSPYRATSLNETPAYTLPETLPQPHTHVSAAAPAAAHHLRHALPSAWGGISYTW